MSPLGQLQPFEPMLRQRLLPGGKAVVSRTLFGQLRIEFDGIESFCHFGLAFCGSVRRQQELIDSELGYPQDQNCDGCPVKFATGLL